MSKILFFGGMMFNTETLFVLGAGASAPYGYPLGKQLIQNIMEDMDDVILVPQYLYQKQFNPSPINLTHYFYDIDPNNNWFKLIMDYVESSISYQYVPTTRDSFQINFKDLSCKEFLKTKIKQINIFQQLKIALESLDPISIDAFLRDNPSYAQAGKTMILYSLLKREDPFRFNINQSKDNWYPLILNDLVAECADNPEKIIDNKIKFITFNYDMSLDFYLYSMLRKVEIFNKEEDKGESSAELFLTQLKINHVYGQLYPKIDDVVYGKYSSLIKEQESRDNHFMSRGHDMSIKDIPFTLLQDFKRFIFSLNHFNNIKTMYDERYHFEERAEKIAEFKADFEWAKEIIFIGFGFDRDNLNILGFPDTIAGFNKVFPGKTIRYLNYQGTMTSLAQEFDKLQKECRNIVSPKPLLYGNTTVNVIQSTADSISSAYLNDFKKFLFR